MRKVLLLSLLFVSMLIIGVRFGSQPLIKFLNLSERAGLRVQANKEASVFVNKKEVGKTPFSDEGMRVGDYLVELRSSEASWSGYVQLYEGTLSVVNRDLSEKQATSSGEVITLERGKGVMVISNPDMSEVEVDGKNYGKTPLVVEEIESGEHVFLVGRSNYLKRSIRAVVVEGFRLNINVDLAISEADLTKLQTEPIRSSKYVVVRKTPTGYLNIRSKPSTGGNLVGRANTGDQLILLEELPNWVRVRTEDGKEGYVSTSYTEKSYPPQ